MIRRRAGRGRAEPLGPPLAGGPHRLDPREHALEAVGRRGVGRQLRQGGLGPLQLGESGGAGGAGPGVSPAGNAPLAAQLAEVELEQLRGGRVPHRTLSFAPAERLAQRRHRPVKARLQRPLRRPGHLGDLGERQLLAAAQDHHLAHEVRQLPQRERDGFRPPGLVQARRDALLTRPLVGKVQLGLVERHVGGAVALAGELAARGVEGDLVDPGPDLAPGRVVRRGPEPHPREGLLQPLLRERAPPPGQPEEDAEDGPLVPPVQDGERVRVAPGHPFEERAVRENGHGGDARWYRLGGAPGQGRQQRERQDGGRAHGLEVLLPAGSYRARPPRVAGGEKKRPGGRSHPGRIRAYRPTRL